jgi:hypothetical protein
MYPTLTGVGMCMILALCLVYCLQVVQLALLSEAHGVYSLIGAFLALFFCAAKKSSAANITFITLGDGGLALLLCALCGLFATMFIDHSVDGQSGYLVWSYEVAQGWNPLKQLSDLAVKAEFADSYPIASVLVGAAWMDIIPRIDIAQVSNGIAWLGTLLLLIGVLRKRLGLFVSLTLSVAAMLGPVFITQLHSSMIDGQLGVLTLAFALFWIERPAKWAFFAVGIYLLGLKFTALLNVGCVFAAFGLIEWIYGARFWENLVRQSKNFALLLFLGIGVFGAQPYVKNLFGYGSVMVQSLADLQAYVAPHKDAYLRDHSRLEGLFTSQFAHSKNISYETSQSKIECKTMGTVYAGEILSFQTPDVRIGGHGPLFGLALFGAGVLFIVQLILQGVARTSWRLFFSYIVLLLIVCASVLINSEAWWARFVPQLYFIPALIIGFSFLQSKRSAIATVLPLCFLLANGLLVTYANYGFSKIQTQNYSRSVDQLNNAVKSGATVYVSVGEMLANAVRLRERGLNYLLLSRYHRNDSPLSVPTVQSVVTARIPVSGSVVAHITDLDPLLAKSLVMPSAEISHSPWMLALEKYTTFRGANEDSLFKDRALSPIGSCSSGFCGPFSCL